MRYRLLIISLIFAPLMAAADGLPLKDGRYPGPVVKFILTKEQREVSDRFWTCHLENYKTMNTFTPYVFTLTSAQSAALAKLKGFSPLYFEVYDTFRGFNDPGPHWNLVLRFSPTQIEIPLDLVVPNSEAWEE